MPYSGPVVPGTNATSTQYNDLRKDLMLGVKQKTSHAYAATVNIDLSDPTLGNLREIALDGNVAVTFSGMSGGDAVFPRALFLEVTQDGVGSRTLTLPTVGYTIKLPGSVFTQPTTNPSATTGYLIIFTSATAYRVYYAGFDLRQPV